MRSRPDGSGVLTVVVSLAWLSSLDTTVEVEPGFRWVRAVSFDAEKDNVDDARRGG
jgi:hypothetical protein